MHRPCCFEDINGMERYMLTILNESPVDRQRRVNYTRAWLKENHYPKNEAIAIKQAWEMAASTLSAD